MAITVILPNALRPLAAFNERVALEAQTMGEAIQKLVERYPHVQTKLPSDPQNPPQGYGVYRNSVDVRRLQGLDTPLRPNDRVTMIVPEGDL